MQQVVWWFSFPCHGDHATRTPNHRRVGCAICTLADLQLGLATCPLFLSWTREVVRAEGMVPDAVPFSVLFLVLPETGEFPWDRQFDGERRQRWRTGSAVLTFTGRCVSHGEVKGREGPICM